MSTPWGAVQHSTPVTRGVSFVSTAGHGGLRISKKFAEKNLSESCIRRGTAIGTYLYYEEDCDWCIPAFELEQYHDKFINENAREKLLKSLSQWNLDYLIERNVEPDEEGARIYRTNRERDELRANKDPNFIVAAVRTDEPNVTKVWTADGKGYLVEGATYAPEKHDLNLLSYCNILSELVK